MADNITTDAGTLASKDVGGVQYPRNLITDETGADAVGAVGASPDANTMLGRLKAIADAITTLSGNVDGLEALATSLNGYVDSLETLQGTTNTSLTTLQGLVDGLEGLLAATATEATLAAISAKLPTLGQKAQSGSVSMVPAIGIDYATGAKQDESKNLLSAIAVLDAPFPITPHATNPLEREIKAIAIVTSGTIVYRHPDEGSDRTVTLPAGLFPLPATHIRDTSTATGLTGF